MQRKITFVLSLVFFVFLFSCKKEFQEKYPLLEFPAYQEEAVHYLFTENKEPICMYENQPLSLRSGYEGSNYSFLWSTEETTSHITANEPGEYRLTVTSEDIYFNDNDTVYYYTSFMGQSTVISCQSELYVPDAFSPDGDGINDKFWPRGAGIEKISMVVFGPGGNAIYIYGHENSPNFGWGGKDLNGEPVPQGNYPYYIKFLNFNGESEEVRGTVKLYPFR